MGTTSKGLRYPESTTPPNSLHTRIKELADDINAELIKDDVEGIPITRYGGAVAKITDLPDNDGVYNTHLTGNIGAVPPNARLAHLSMAHSARCDGNAQCHWYPQYTPNGGGTYYNFAPEFYSTHNSNNPAIDMGMRVSITIDVSSWRNQQFALAMSGRNDSGSVAWVHVAYLHWAVTFLS